MSARPTDDKAVISATEVARKGTIMEQNGLIAAAYAALHTARVSMTNNDCGRPEIEEVEAAIGLIEEWRQKREPAAKPKERT